MPVAAAMALPVDPGQALLSQAANQGQAQTSQTPATGEQQAPEQPNIEQLVQQAVLYGAHLRDQEASQAQILQNVQQQDAIMQQHLQSVQDPRQRTRDAAAYKLWRDNQELAFRNVQLEAGINELGSSLQPLMKEKLYSDIASAEGITKDLILKYAGDDPKMARSIAKVIKDFQKEQAFEARKTSGVDGAPNPTGQSPAGSVGQLTQQYRNTGDIESFHRARLATGWGR